MIKIQGLDMLLASILNFNLSVQLKVHYIVLKKSLHYCYILMKFYEIILIFFSMAININILYCRTVAVGIFLNLFTILNLELENLIG